jgi:hypothetical protein
MSDPKHRIIWNQKLTASQIARRMLLRSRFKAGGMARKRLAHDMVREYETFHNPVSEGSAV